MPDRDERKQGATRSPHEVPAEEQPIRDAVHPLLRRRFSPTAFDGGHRMTWAEVVLLVEAARWAPSAGNSQPWMFRPIMFGTPEHQRLVPLLAGSSRPWASHASVIMLNLRRQFVPNSSMEYSEFSDYDLGQAVAHMTIQAQSMGLACRQFRAFDLPQVVREFCVPEEWDLRTMTAVGRPADTPPLDRIRRDLGDVLAFNSRRYEGLDQAGG